MTLTEADWLALTDPCPLSAIQDRVDPTRFHDLALRWCSRVVRFARSDHQEWFASYSAWVKGEGPHPKSVFKSLVENIESDRSLSRCPSAAIESLVWRDDPFTSCIWAGEAHADVEVDRAVGAAPDHSTAESVRTAAYAVFEAEFRDVAGNPFRPVTFDPAWRTSAVLTLADHIYAGRAFDRLPILADALQDAGCEDAAVLAHCRGPGPHVRGCWVVDLVLGKA
jgi:hypothetical protein